MISFFCVLAPEGMNEIVFEEIRGRGQKSTATQKVCLPAFLFALTLHLLWSILFIFCLLAPEGMNAIVFGRDKGERSEDYCLLGRGIIQKIIFFL